MRKGCFSFLISGFFAIVFATVFASNLYLDTVGTLTTGTVYAKREMIWVHYGDWSRDLEVLATYYRNGEPFPSRTGCQVTEETYDSLRVGSPVAVRYLPSRALRDQPFIPASRLADCTVYTAFKRRSAQIGKWGAIVGAFVALVLLWRLLKIRLAGWLALCYAGVIFAYIAIPNTEPVPVHARSATATVQNVTTISTMLEGDNNEGIDLAHPYQIVELSFKPDGVNDSVVAVDKIDLDSVPGLQKGSTVPITYDALRPRIARLNGGTRSFPAHAVMTAALCFAAFLGLLSVWWIISSAFQKLSRTPLMLEAKRRREQQRFRK
jgi:hypothetical protein